MKLHFLLKYGKNLVFEQRNQALSTILSISLAVALMVALQSVSILSSETLETNVKQLCGGDLRVSSFLEPLTHEDVRTLSDIEHISYSFESWGKAKAISRKDNKSLIFVIRGVSEAYPLYGFEICKSSFETLDHSIIIDRTLADRAQLAIGDVLEIYTDDSSLELAVVQIVEPDGETAEDMHIFGYGFCSYGVATGIVGFPQSEVNRIYIATEEDTLTSVLETVRTLFPYSDVIAYTEFMEERSQEYSAIMSFFTVVGLAAVCLGGIGVSSAVLLTLGKKNREIGILKSIGFKHKDIMILFLFAFLVLSLVSTLLGLFLGLFLSYTTVHLSNSLLYTTLSWSFKCEPLFWGVAIGFGSVLGFGFFPALMSRSISPDILLRREAQIVPSISFKLVFVEVTIVGFFVSLIMKSFWGFLLCYMFFLTALALFHVFMKILSILSGLPCRGFLKVSLRTLKSHKTKNSLIMLTLILTFSIVGSLIALSENIKDAFQQSASESLGFDVMVFHKKDDSLTQFVNNVPGVTHVAVVEILPVRLSKVQGKEISDFQEEIRKHPVQQLFRSPRLMGSELPSHEDILEGRALTESDRGEYTLLILEDLARTFDIHPGHTVRLIVGNTDIEFEIVGIFKKELILAAEFKTSLDTIYSIATPTAETLYIRTDDSSSLVSAVYENFPESFVMKVEDITPSLDRVINRQFLFLSILSLFSLGAGIIIIYSTVSMEILERRREVGIFKAVGLKNASISRIIISEKCIVGILSGIISSGLIVVGSHFIIKYMLQGRTSIPFLTLGVLLCLSLVLSWLASFFPVRSTLKEKPLHILRYE